ncbi:LNS2-domain-containing protein [Dendrothele bispora CBS 962.96]|uniref:phosphatidate phosphatase n=1 Tax=Dendrothele bispora (strain CBS 962.96) TaxID=1314807 RepID=A0A4S8MXV1_DENBC|nr:LNS2-domain-containing protein [Dendrothele bispora CBS 962.96]
MNYLRGAVNAISAPYQYYKDLPPINPSTLTGAIDVIVIQRPTDNGGIELACSPFHVRFGKWQVLRPSEKKVNVSVNGHPIPFDMKIGEAGEAFFVFETEDDVPEDLITSPVLKPTTSEVPPERSDEAATPGRFGAKEDESSHQEEPDYFELDADPSSSQNAVASSSHTHPITPSPSPPLSKPHAGQSQPGSHGDSNPLPSPPPSPSGATQEQDRRVDAALKRKTGKDLSFPKVEYRDGVALDTKGYHATKKRAKEVKEAGHPPVRDRERSDRTVRADEYDDDYNGQTSDQIQFPSSDPPPSDSESDEEDAHKRTPTIPFPAFRAASEPPPDILDLSYPSSLPNPSISSGSIGSSRPKGTSSQLSILTPVQEYSWEWGAFPQPSPMKPTFNKSGLKRGIGVFGEDDSYGQVFSGRLTNSPKGTSRHLDLGEGSDDEGRSRSVPPQLDGSPRIGRKILTEEKLLPEGYGAGGRLRPSKSDPTKLRVMIEGRKVDFELSLVQYDDHIIVEREEEEEPAEEEENRGRRDRAGSRRGVQVRVYSPDGRWKGIDEFETARLFDKGKVTFQRFIEDSNVVEDPRLVIRWPGDQYITQDDGSPLLEALRIWRDSYITKMEQKTKANPHSTPLSEDEAVKSGDEDTPLERPKLSPPEETQPAQAGKPPTSSSWVKWWSRSRTNTSTPTPPSGNNINLGADAAQKVQGRPELKERLSEPPFSEKTVVTSRGLVERPSVESAPVPSTPIQQPQDAMMPVSNKLNLGKKYVKTLRLTSDQLKSLNLKPGPNTITFSLSATGTIACTARIFVWDSTDFVLISDIDGTITKSDGLGHVFAMIGRDWTHLGVAKLYTDICRNGYKIMYLTSRAIGQADATRGYLKGIKQNDYQLPEGPVIMSPDRLMASLHREVIMRKPEVFKMACLRDIQRLFGEARNPFYAGFGNRITDALSYRSVNVPSSRIFTIDSTGEVKLELLELAGYKSSYIHMTDLVDQMFPPIHKKWAPEFTDFNYWKTPMQDFPLPDLSPPSPALSARSDSTTFSRLRNFSLVGNRSSNVPKSVMASSASSVSGDDSGAPQRSDTLKQMSSFERFSNTLGFSRSASPESRSSNYADSEGEDDEVEWEWDGSKKRTRRRSMTSMPGSLEDMDMEFDDNEEEEGEHEYDEEYDEEQEQDELDEQAAEQALEEDLLAADDMKNVPFL